MADSFVQVTEGTGKKIDNEEVTVGANTVYRQRVQVTGAQAATIAQVSVGAGSTAIIAANLKRQGLTIHNQSAIEILAVKFGTAAVYASSFTQLIAPGQSFRWPGPVYQGIIHGIFESGGTGNVMVTEEF